jgi:hypothetical protein
MGMLSGVLTIPKAFGFEAATQLEVDNLHAFLFDRLRVCPTLHHNASSPLGMKIPVPFFTLSIDEG